MKSTKVERHQTNTTGGGAVRAPDWEGKAFWGFLQIRERLIGSTSQGGAGMAAEIKRICE